MIFLATITIKTIRIALSLPVGIVNEARIKRIKEEFGPAFNALNDGTNVIFVNPDGKRSFALNAQQIIVGFDGEGVTPDFDWTKETIDKICDILMLDKKSGFYFQLIANCPAMGSSKDNSIDLVLADKKAAILEIYPELEAVGIRFIGNHESGIVDFKVEPLLANPSQYYIEAIINFPVVTDLDNITKLADNSYTYIHSTLFQLAEKYIMSA
jgi:hypothetical protein